MTDKTFMPPPEELIHRWSTESGTKPTMQSAFNYVAYKAAEWGFNEALCPDPNSLKLRALRALSKVESLEVVSIWIGTDALKTIRKAIESLPSH